MFPVSEHKHVVAYNGNGGKVQRIQCVLARIASHSIEHKSGNQ